MADTMYGMHSQQSELPEIERDSRERLAVIKIMANEEETEDDGVVYNEFDDQNSLLLSGDTMDDMFAVGIWYPKDCKVSFEGKGHRMEILVEKKDVKNTG